MARQYFLIKSEPHKYAWADLVRDERTVWDGVRNFEARNNLRSMRPGDLLLFYHSNEGKQVVGVAQLARTAYPDSTAPGEDWSVVEITPLCSLQRPVALDAIRAEKRLAGMDLLRKTRLSVVPVTKEEFTLILKIGATSLPRKSSAQKHTEVSA